MHGIPGRRAVTQDARDGQTIGSAVCNLFCNPNGTILRRLRLEIVSVQSLGQGRETGDRALQSLGISACSTCVCKEQCWNDKRGLCKECAPDLGVEMSAAQASRSVEEVWAHAKMSEEDKKLSAGNWRETIVASCPQCGASQETNAKFCPQCGAALKADPHCTQCGEKLQPNAKFCAGCGAPAPSP